MADMDVTSSMNGKNQMEYIVDSDMGRDVYIKTFVMFDTETTGLPSPGNNPHFTELCFIALTREELHTKQSESRVLNKLLICFNPRKNIPHGSSNITGLHNDALEELAPFSKQAPLISMFLKNLPQPVCLIAHNGIGFDFPLLVSHMKKANEELPKGILCADSLEAFRMFDGLSPVPDFVLQKRREKKALALSKTTNTKIVKPLNTISTLSGNGCNEYSAAQDVANDCKTDLQIVENNQIDNPECRKRNIDFIDCDQNCKQAKLFPEQTELWDTSTCTPQKPIIDITRSVCPQIVAHSSESLCTTGHEVRRQLFKEDEPKQNQTSDLQPTRGTKEGAIYIQNTCKNMGVSSFKGVSVRHSQGFETDVTEFSTNTEMCDRPSKVNRDDTLMNSAVSERADNNKVAPNVNRDDTLMNSAVSERADNNKVAPNVNNIVFTMSKAATVSDSISDAETITSCIPCNVNDTNSGKSPSVVKTQTVSYSLPCVYKRCFHQEPKVAHTAESDCLTLLRIIRFKTQQFSSWCDSHAVPLDSIDPMY